jgi:ribulose-phosphate 3-epimerase
MLKIAASILSADFMKLGEEIDSIKSADFLHFDVMDGIFVPNISIGLPVLQSVRGVSDMTLDVHLMITEPLRLVDRFIEAGADIITFHIEADTSDSILKTIRQIRQAGKKVGLSLRPKTKAYSALPYLGLIDVLLIMTVEPGFGGQAFMSEQLKKITELRAMVDKSGKNCEIEVDGGINPETAALCAGAGADILVAGSDVFAQTDREKRIFELRGI